MDFSKKIRVYKGPIINKRVLQHNRVNSHDQDNLPSSFNSNDNSTIIERNRMAMLFLKDNDFPKCFSLLKQAENLILQKSHESMKHFQAMTLNNLGCYYKK